jgi:phosphatidylinositol alpha-mannosyltransferase
VSDPRVFVAGRPRPVPASGSVARISLDPFVGRKVATYLHAQQFDVVHVHEPLMPAVNIEALRRSRRANPDVVNVGTFHANRENGNALYRAGRQILKRSFSELDGKIAVSTPAARFVGGYFRGFYNIIPNGVDLERWSNPRLEPIPEFNDGMINILYVGRAEKRKGLDYLLKAFSMVNARQWNTRLLVVGPDSRRRRRVQARVEESNLRGVVFIDGPTAEELPRWHRTSHIFCSPATGNESQGIVLLEAMAAGIPVVASNIEGYASVITHNIDGVLVRPRDRMGLADALSGLVRDADSRAALAEAGKRRAEDYSWAHVTQRILSYYERLRDERRIIEEGEAFLAGTRVT